MNPALPHLQPYPFARLRKLLADTHPNPKLPFIRLSIGEPQHPPPPAVLTALQNALPKIAHYPATEGSPELRTAIACWLQKRFALSQIDPATQILPVNGTREALFAVTQALTGAKPETPQKPTVLMPNPCYQIYEGAALLASAQPLFYPLDPKTGQPNLTKLTEVQLDHCQLMYLCTPGNPNGRTLPAPALIQLINLARAHNFTLISDECYGELYLDENHPSPGLLQACDQLTPGNYSHCLSFHSLSKRSNLPGLRSGFVAGDPARIAQFLRYRTYHGSAMPPHHQAASIAAWQDEKHVVANRQKYRQKYRRLLPILADHFPFTAPDAGFYLWLKTPIDDREFARTLYAQENLLALPGSFLARQINSQNPGQNRLRIALASNEDELIEAAQRLCRHAARLSP
ncbi:MAG: succinyldiaminopimelate transaminase [Cellvibrionales bacterium]|nr:succinyldiaminopimelate transaminase [Cellvibrionales bacterium]